MGAFDYTDAEQPVSTAIIEAVAEKSTAEPAELPPLYQSVDVDAIEELFQPTLHGDGRTGAVEFRYHGCDVTVEFDPGTTGTVHVEPTDGV